MAHRSALALVAWLLAVAVVVPARALAHGDENHGPPAPVAAGAASTTEHVVATETELFTVVVKYPARGQGGRLPIRLYIANVATSAPVERAGVRLELQNVADVRAVARDPGVYEANIPEPRAGTHANAVVTIEAAEVDIVTMEGLTFGPITSPGAPAASHPATIQSRLWRHAPVAGAVVGAVMLAMIVVAVVRRRRARRPAALVSQEVQ